MQSQHPLGDLIVLPLVAENTQRTWPMKVPPLSEGDACCLLPLGLPKIAYHNPFF
jgi:hypothetical protein